VATTVFELVQRETGLWAILQRTGRTAIVVETGHVDPALAAQDLASYASSRTLSLIGQGWLKVADRLAGNMKSGRRDQPQRAHDVLNRVDVLRLLRAQDYRCAVSGSYFTHNAFDDEKRDPFQPSTDRISSSAGYVHGNVRIVCLLVNLAMSSWGEEPLRKIAERISRPTIRPDYAPMAEVGRTRLRLLPCFSSDVDQYVDHTPSTVTVSHCPACRVPTDTESLVSLGDLSKCRPQ
jgi:hypothetical protein